MSIDLDNPSPETAEHTRMIEHLCKQRDDLRVDRDRLAAELHAVKDERDGLHRTLKAVVDFAIDECGMPTRYMLGSDAPVRVMRKLKQDRDSYANSDFERQLAEARAENARLLSIIGLSMSPGTAESLARLERMEPLRTVLRSWCWASLAEEGVLPSEAEERVIRAFAHVEEAENEAAKAKGDGNG